MKNKLLITTALVALSVSGNAYAENLPEDATNLTSGNYVVERSDTQVSHSGDINLSGTASLDGQSWKKKPMRSMFPRP